MEMTGHGRIRCSRRWVLQPETSDGRQSLDDTVVPSCFTRRPATSTVTSHILASFRALTSVDRIVDMSITQRIKNPVSIMSAAHDASDTDGWAGEHLQCNE